MVIENGFVFRDEGYFERDNLYIENDRIVSVSGGEVIDAEGLYVIPGLVDIHFHGCVGYDFSDGTVAAIEKIAGYQLQHGVTAICLATMTLPIIELEEIMEAAASYKGKCGASLVGIYLEGPFLSSGKAGAQNRAYLCKPDSELFYHLQKKAKGLIKLVSLAPELPGAMEFIKEINKSVRVSLAHTNTDYDVAMAAFAKGARHVTHLYNAMNPFLHRSPGIIGAACDSENVMVELITDGVHIHPAVVRATFKMFGEDKIIFVSDSMRACGLEDGQYWLGGQQVTVKGKMAVLTADGTLAGSVSNLMDCMKYAVKNMKIPLESAVKCASVNPAKALGIYQERGSLKPGKIADAVLLDKNLNIRYIIREGKVM